MNPQSISIIITGVAAAIFLAASLGIFIKRGKPSNLSKEKAILGTGITGIIAFVALIICACLCINNSAGCDFCSCDDASSPQAVPTPGPTPTPSPQPAPSGGDSDSPKMYSNRVGAVTGLLGGSNVFAENGGERTILVNNGENFVYPLSDDGKGNGVTTGRHMSFSLFLGGINEGQDDAGIVSAVYMVPIPPISKTGGSSMSYGGIAVDDAMATAMGALYNDGQGIGYVTNSGYFSNAGRTEIDLMETSQDSCQTTHHGIFGTYYSDKDAATETNLPSRLGNTSIDAQGDGNFPNYIIQENMAATSTIQGLDYDTNGLDIIDGCVDPNGIWNNPYTVSSINKIDYYNDNWGYGQGKYIDTRSLKGVQYDYYMKPVKATSNTPSDSKLADYYKGISSDEGTTEWYTLQIYYRIVQEQDDGTVHYLPNEDYYNALKAVPGSNVDEFIVTNSEAGSGLWFLVDSNISEAQADACALPRAPQFYSAYDLKYMILTQSYWTPSLIGQAGAGPTIWLDGNEDTSGSVDCTPSTDGGSQCDSDNADRNVACGVCRGPNVSAQTGDVTEIPSGAAPASIAPECANIQQDDSSNYAVAQQLQNKVACQGAPSDPAIGNMSLFEDPNGENCCNYVTKNYTNSFYNIFFNLYIDLNITNPSWTLDYQYRGVNSVKTAPGIANPTNLTNWRGGYAPQFGICSVGSGWVSAAGALPTIDTLAAAGQDPVGDTCGELLSGAGTMTLNSDEPATVPDLADEFGEDGKEWYELICMPSGAKGDTASGKSVMDPSCNFLATTLQSRMP